MPPERGEGLCSLLYLGAVLALAACRTAGPPPDSAASSSAGGDGDSALDRPIVDGEPNCTALDESGCQVLPTDFLSHDPDADPFPACVSDDGVYHLVDTSPGSIARVGAYEQIGDLLWRDGTPTPEMFKDARGIYETPEGLKSRLERREDLHYPPVPAADWDPGVDRDKQCTVQRNVEKYPGRCAGPALINPLITRAFLDGAGEIGDPRAAAARIEAGGLWFLYLSVYKEAFTCTANGKDCDSAWAYYTGGAQADGAGLGLARVLAAISPSTHQRIFDGVLAVRCFRDLYDLAAYPTYEDLPPAGKALFDQAWEQLDTALHRGYAVVLRDRMQELSACKGSGLPAVFWAFLRAAGPVIGREALERDPVLGAELATLWALELPTLDDLARGIDLLDALFPCP